MDRLEWSPVDSVCWSHSSVWISLMMREGGWKNNCELLRADRSDSSPPVYFISPQPFVFLPSYASSSFLMPSLALLSFDLTRLSAYNDCLTKYSNVKDTLKE